jgi:hypothetical protein
MRRSIVSIRTTAACVALASCLAAQTALAQYKPGQREPTSFGLVGGLNLANVSGSDADLFGSSKNRTGFYAGAAATIPLGTSLFFQPQALFSMKGAKYSETGTSVEIRLNYVEVPAFLGFRIPMQGSQVRPYVMAGPYVGFKMSCKLHGEEGGVSVNLNCDDSQVGLKVRGVDFGLAFGAGVEFPMGGGTLALGARYGLGLSNVPDVTPTVNVKNSVISFGAGYFFGRH